MGQQQQQPPPPPPPPSVWEKFLNKKTVSVLLVETDESNRRAVAAVLRHLRYQVIPAENGHQAWAYLRLMGTNIDLVLAETMPGLLDRIMNHSVYKNIPVIMMSSNFTMDTIFQCVSKGCADFLIKPIRTNELITLWQHVWRRRCQSVSSGSGSRSDIQMTQKRIESKRGDVSNNNGGSNYRNGDTSMGHNARGGTDYDSGTQFIVKMRSSWTKRALAIDSPQDMPPDQSADPADSTRAHVIHRKSEICSNRLLPDELKGKELEIGGPTNLNTDDQSSPNEGFPPRKILRDTIMENLEEPLVRAVDLLGPMAKNMDAQQEARAKDSPNCSSKVPEGKETYCDGVMPSLELSLKRPRSTGDGANAFQEEQRNVFRRSDLPPFTRYNTFVVSNQGGAGFVGSCSPYDSSSEAAKTDCTYSNVKSSSDAGLMKQGSDGSSNNNDMASTAKNVATKPGGSKVSPINGKTHTWAFHHVQPWTPVATGKDKADDVGKKNAAGGKDKAGEAESKHPWALHVENARSTGVPQSNVADPSALVEDHAAKYGSNSGGNNNANNRSTGTTAADAINVETGGDDESYDIIYLKDRRAASLNKYRKKRNKLNFGKKVRYHGRKWEAEQRPRIRGQFVRER